MPLWIANLARFRDAVRMSNEDDPHLRGTIRFEDIDVDQSSDEVPDLLQKVEGRGHEVDAVTNPFMSSLPKGASPDDTIREAPSIELIEASRPTKEFDRPTINRQQNKASTSWRQRYSVVDQQGMLKIYLQDSGFKPGDKVEVLVRVIKE